MPKLNKKITKDSRYRDFLSIFMNTIPENIHIRNSDQTNSIIHENGNVYFTVLFKDMGLTNELYLKHKSEILSKFFVDFMGEFLVRENLDQFAKLLTGTDLGDQAEIMNKRSHVKFGLDIRPNEITFIFHASLLQQILTEDFKMQVQDFV